MLFKTLNYSIENSILTITLNRPKKLNALNDTMASEILSALDQADQDDNVRVIIFTGEGRAFCSGADLEQGQDTFNYDDSHPHTEEGRAPRDIGGVIALRLFNAKKPIIGAVNGAAVGFGSSMLLPMDIRIASTAARFGFVFTRLGIVPEAASSWFLPRVVGIGKALEWSARGNIFDAHEAHKAGLVNYLVEPDQLLSLATTIATEIAEKSAPVSVTMARQMMWRMMSEDHPMAAHQLDSIAVYQRGKQSDVGEGIEALLQKRPANFIDKPSQDMPSIFPWWDEPDY